LHVEIENLLSFQKHTVVNNIYPVSVFVGPNNAGKSNFIRVLQFYKDLLSDTKEHYPNHGNIKEKFHQLADNSTCTIKISYTFEDSDLSRDPLRVDHFLLYNRDGKFDKERFFLHKNGKEITVIKKEDYKFFEKKPEVVRDFLSGTKVDPSPEADFNEISWAKYGPFFWPNTSENPGIRIYNEIKRYIDSWIFIPADRIKNISKRLDRLKELPETIPDTPLFG